MLCLCKVLCGFLFFYVFLVQTDMMDLLGSDLPVESDEGMKFSWSDGILLQALKEGCWVLLDELNLAPQSVLEGLNAILDHRAEVFIPELGNTYKCPPSFRIFACQNPSHQGGGRKGLPRSFLNRFTKEMQEEIIALKEKNSKIDELMEEIALLKQRDNARKEEIQLLMQMQNSNGRQGLESPIDGRRSFESSYRIGDNGSSRRTN